MIALVISGVVLLLGLVVILLNRKLCLVSLPVWTIRLWILLLSLWGLLLGSCVIFRRSRSDVCYGPPDDYNREKTIPDSLNVQKKKITPPADVDYGPPEYFILEEEEQDSLKAEIPQPEPMMVYGPPPRPKKDGE